MCGLGAIIEINTNKDSISKKLDLIENCQINRGPDSIKRKIVEINNNDFIGLCFQRLSILDVKESSDQPITFCNERFTLMFNGEIYNYLEIKKSINYSKTLDAALGDTGVICAAYEKWGDECFSMFEGMWAIVIYDKVKKEITVSRDRLGIKPLHYYQKNNSLIIASEVKSILSATEKKFQLNIETISNYLNSRTLNTTTSTFFDEISMFKPASIVKYKIQNKKISKLSESKFWNLGSLNDSIIQLNLDDKKKYLENLLIDIHKKYLRSDVPIGIMLSGGIDSTIMHNITVKQKKGITSLSIISDDEKFSEEKFINCVTSEKKSNSIKINISKSKINIHDLIRNTWANDQPLQNLSIIGHSMMMKKAKQLGIKVLLTGQGADELFCGYRKFIFFYLKSLFKENPLRNLKLCLKIIIKNQIFKSFSIIEAKRYIPYLKKIKKYNSLINKEILNIDKLNLGMRKDFNDRRILDINSLSIPNLLHYEDRISMFNSIEMRVPFLDHRLVDFSLSLTPEEIFCDHTLKSFLKISMKNYIPEMIFNRKAKSGFGIPQNKILKKIICQTDDYFFQNSKLFEMKILHKENFNKQIKKIKNDSSYNFIEFFPIFSLFIWSVAYAEFIE